MLVSAFAAVVTTLAALTQAGPVTSALSIKLLDSIRLEEGNIVFYGYDSELEARTVDHTFEICADCGDKDVSCDGSHAACVKTCYFLRQDLVSRQNENPGAGNRRICHALDSRHRCCVSWASGMSLKIGNLIPGFDSGYKCNGNKRAKSIVCEGDCT